VGAVLLAGDFFDTDLVTVKTMQEVFSTIRAAAPIPFFYVSGNHDGGLDFSKLAPENFYFFGEGKGYTLQENITITGLNASDFSPARFQSLALRADAFNILLLHGDCKKDFSIPDLRGKNLDYLALGHIHKPDLQALAIDGRGKYRYCGCLEGRGFDEVGERGFFLLEIKKGRLERERFLSLATRKVEEAVLDLTGIKTYFELESAANLILEKIPATSMLKLVLAGRCEATLPKNIPLLRERLSSKIFHLKIEDRSRVQVDISSFQNDLTQRGEFVRAVGRCEMNAELKEEVLEVGLKALMGEEIDL
jgi:DNA repair exonuclease SbcCD nuclease subunit